MDPKMMPKRDPKGHCFRTGFSGRFSDRFLVHATRWQAPPLQYVFKTKRSTKTVLQNQTDNQGISARPTRQARWRIRKQRSLPFLILF